MTQTTPEVRRRSTAAALRPDQDGFEALARPLRRELLAHCYRMTGSVHDAEDAVQETWLRAWRALPEFEGRSSLRTWMYRIATRVCLSHLEGRARRPLPVGLDGQPTHPALEPLPGHGVPRLEPLPGNPVWTVADRDPADRAVDSDTVRRALVAALQHLTAQQRAVLLLRDVLAWSAAEVAVALGLSVAAVNSTLQRARGRTAALEAAPAPGELTPDQRHLLRRYVAAFEAYDVAALVTLLAADVVGEMPAHRGWRHVPPVQRAPAPSGGEPRMAVRLAPEPVGARGLPDVVTAGSRAATRLRRVGGRERAAAGRPPAAARLGGTDERLRRG